MQTVINNFTVMVGNFVQFSLGNISDVDFDDYSINVTLGNASAFTKIKGNTFTV